jgi:phosphoglucosamine mutase
VGRDTRLSGPLLQAALSAGMASEGADVVDVGVLPTPGVAHLSEAGAVPAAVISASHNPFSDNGVKLFAAGGRKLADALEQRLEAELAALLASAGAAHGTKGAAVGRLMAQPGSAGAYTDHLVGTLEGRSLGGLRVALDCANGAASAVAAGVLRAAGADVEVIHDEPDGVNINDGCGSTYPGDLQRLVVATGADAGLALDGDADRVVAVDHTGAVVDGDQMMAVCALDLRGRGALAGDTVVVTVMSNLGLKLALAGHGIAVVETAVGDRNVLAALEDGGYTLGGEQSGHVVFRHLATTGDGLLTGLLLLDVVRRSGHPLAELAAVMTRLPQVLRNVPVGRRAQLDGADGLWKEVAEVEAALGGRGRVLLRPSGTEPLVRVMVEAPTEEEAAAAAARLCAAVERELGPPG